MLRRRINPWERDAWKLASVVFFFIISMAIWKQSHPEPQVLSPLGTGQVTIFRVKETKVVKVNVAEIVNKIWQLESSRGKAKEGLAVYCKDQGMSNEYGYGGMDGKICFRNHKEATAMIHLWFNTQLETKTLERALCYYNTGRPADDCDYLQKYLEAK